MGNMDGALGHVARGIGYAARMSQQRVMFNEAAKRFESIGSQEGKDLAGILRANPLAAGMYAQQFGGLGKLYSVLQEQAALAEMGRMFEGLGDEPMDQAALLRRVMPQALKAGINPAAVASIANAYARADNPAWVDQIDPDLYDNFGEFYSHGRRTGDWEGASTMLRRRPTAGDGGIDNPLENIKGIGGGMIAVNTPNGVVLKEVKEPGLYERADRNKILDANGVYITDAQVAEIELADEQRSKTDPYLAASGLGRRSYKRRTPKPSSGGGPPQPGEGPQVPFRYEDEMPDAGERNPYPAGSREAIEWIYRRAGKTGKKR